MWRWFPQQRQSFLANQVVLSGRRRAQGIASSGRTKSLQPSLNLWWCWTWGEEKMMVRTKRLHLVSWFTQKAPHQNVPHPFSNPFNSICTLQVKISLYVGYLVSALFIWIQLYRGWLVFGAHFAAVGLHIVRWIFEVYCTRVDLYLVYLEHIVQEVAHERRRVLVGACYVDHRVTGRQEACKGGGTGSKLFGITFLIFSI